MATSGSDTPGLAKRVLAEIRERGPLGSRDFTGKPDPAPRRKGASSAEQCWPWKPAKQMLDALFASGELVIADRRPLSASLRPTEASSPQGARGPNPLGNGGDQGTVMRVVRARGALSESALSTREARVAVLGGAKAGALTSTLCCRREVRAAAVATAGAVVVEAGVEPDRRRPNAAILLSPFDNLLGAISRDAGARFEHVIELYKPAPSAATLLRPALPLRDHVGRAT